MSIEQFSYIAAPFIVGGFVGYGFSFLNGFKDEFFADRKEVREHKVNVARKVHKFNVAAIGNRFKNFPSDFEYVANLIAETKGVNYRMSQHVLNLAEEWRSITHDELTEVEREEHKKLAAKRTAKLTDWCNRVKNRKDYWWKRLLD